MRRVNRPLLARQPSRQCFLVLIWIALLTSSYRADCESAHADATEGTAILWSDPGNIRSRDLYYGVGGRENEPQPPFTFLEESKAGANPKFDVRDKNGTNWRVKLGEEAQPEIVASRLLWAVGYFANENYLVSGVKIENLRRLHRGQQFIQTGGLITRGRLQKHAEKEKHIGDWSWRKNPFTGTREFNGLRVMMALISNWDLRDENNAVYSPHDQPGAKIYQVSDVGSAFGMSGKSYTDSLGKNNLGAYSRSKFISKKTAEYVDFNFPTHPPFFYIFNPQLFFGHLRMRWIGKHIPREDARWIGSLLGQLSHDQIADAFRAAGYRPEQIEAYTKAVEKRIAELKAL